MNKKKILLVDDSALMRRVLCDIINLDGRFQVVDRATNGLEAFDLLSRKVYDAVVLDINMPKMNGLELLRKFREYKITANIVVASTDTTEGAGITLDALDLGALDFIHKPENAFDCRGDFFKKEFLKTLYIVSESRQAVLVTSSRPAVRPPKAVIHNERRSVAAGSRVVAIASSTGGPKALQEVVSRLPKDLKAPVLVVQHMPVHFTASLAERLNSISELEIKEAAEGDVLENGRVYLARGGKHMNVRTEGARHVIYYSDEPSREGVKPCANYMYESLANCKYDEVICVVMTGMGADGTKGIQALQKQKNIRVIAQEQSTCAVYGMPRSIVEAGLADEIVPLEQIAKAIITNMGVK